jgi:hypothetical protein
MYAGLYRRHVPDSNAGEASSSGDNWFRPCEDVRRQYCKIWLPFRVANRSIFGYLYGSLTRAISKRLCTAIVDKVIELRIVDKSTFGQIQSALGGDFDCKARD